MKKTSTIFSTITITLFSALCTMLLPHSLFATTNVCTENVPQEVKDAAGCGGGGADQLPDAIIGIINAALGILSLIAVIFVIVGGVQYMTAAGDPSKIKKGKDTLLYAIIGLIVCMLAVAIVNFVIGAIK